ncbi:MAG: type II toxin-antitoxin system RelE/ParE family toxin [Clostridiales Family XIII bacterium]|jgi:addiction module RelE/StbE family toxin|nr:type II toxin-antitoxin system RelE/ParE family toxin [Clostridiales Family XIII bacterium]
MAYKVRISDSAEHDLNEIFKYIAEKLVNPRASVDFANALEEKYGKLEMHPLMFERSRNERLAQKGYRRFVVGGYVVLYIVNEEQQEVTIARIFYGKQNYDKYI